MSQVSTEDMLRELLRDAYFHRANYWDDYQNKVMTLKEWKKVRDEIDTRIILSIKSLITAEIIAELERLLNKVVWLDDPTLRVSVEAVGVGHLKKRIEELKAKETQL